MKKVLYIHHGKGIGGAAISLLQMVKVLDRQKFKPFALFMQNSDAVELFEQSGIKVIGPINRYDFSHTAIWWYRWYHLQHFFWSFLDFWRVSLFDAPRFFAQIQPDVIHLNTSSLAAWAIAAWWHNKPLIWHIREPLAPGYFGLRKALIIWMVKKFATKIVAICHNDAKPWKKLAKTTVIYNAVDHKKFTASAQKTLKNKINLLFVGGSSQTKGALAALDILAALLQKNLPTHLTIAGYWQKNEVYIFKKIYKAFGQKTPQDNYFSQLEQTRQELKKSVTLTGPVKNIVPLMQQCDFLLFPCSIGHFARPVIEAGFLGKIALASNLPPLNELIIDQKTGFLLDPKKPQHWAEIIASCWKNPRQKKLISEQAKKLCQQKFHLKKQIVLVEKSYTKSCI